MKTVEILKAARELLVSRGWTQGTFARDEAGAEVGSRSSYASCFCAWGALNATGATGQSQTSALRALDRAAPDGNIVRFNDNAERTVEEVLAVFDKAIAAEEARG